MMYRRLRMMGQGASAMITPEQKTQLRRMWLRGLAARRIARALGTSEDAVRDCARALRLPLAPGERSPAPWPEQDAELERLYCADAVSLAEIVDRLGRSEESIRQRIRARGLRRPAAAQPSCVAPSPRIATRAPPRDNRAQRRLRRCLCGCDTTFLSRHAGERFRPDHRGDLDGCAGGYDEAALLADRR
jgi:DNA-binding CsgD family transcriptional regulator